MATVMLAALEQDAMPTEVWDEVTAAMNRWESLIAVEIGDVRRAEVIRLVGDGLFSEAMLTGSAPSPERIDALVDFLLGDDGAERST